jgi:hypothetical protein
MSVWSFPLKNAGYASEAETPCLTQGQPMWLISATPSKPLTTLHLTAHCLRTPFVTWTCGHFQPTFIPVPVATVFGPRRASFV